MMYFGKILVSKFNSSLIISSCFAWFNMSGFFSDDFAFPAYARTYDACALDCKMDNLAKTNDSALLSKSEKEECLLFLYELKDEVFENCNFVKLKAMINPNASVNQVSMNDNWYKYRRDQKLANYIFDKIASKDKTFLNDCIFNNEYVVKYCQSFGAGKAPSAPLSLPKIIPTMSMLGYRHCKDEHFVNSFKY